MTDKIPADPAGPKRTAAAKKPVAKKSGVPAVPPVEAAPAVPVTAAVAPAPVAVAPAGWYPVAAGVPQLRWWDGTQWTEHMHDPAASGSAAYVPVEELRAPAGTTPGTVWFWLLAVGVPLLQVLDLIPTSIFLNQILAGVTQDPSNIVADELSPAYLILVLCGWFIYAVCIVFAALDWRELKARGIPKPFHWAWSFFVLAVGWPAVYMIGRTVIARRRTGTGMAPLWVFIALQVAAFIVSVVVIILAFAQFFTLLNNGLSTAGNLS